MDKKVYKRIAKSQKKHWWFFSRREIFTRLIKSLKIKRNSKILDYGTGVGANIRLLKKFSINRISLHDQNKQLLNKLIKKNNFTTNYNPKTKYDLIVCTDVFEHIKNDKEIFIRLIEKLKKNGYLFITVPAYQVLYSKKDKSLHHFRRYNKLQLINFINNKSIVISKISYFNFFLFIPISISILLLKILKIDFIDETEKVPNFLINNIFKKIFSFEKYFINKFSFPFGLSLLAIVKKK